MDLRIVIHDENGDVMDRVTIYQDGSDSEGVTKIRRMLEGEFDVENDDEEGDNHG